MADERKFKFISPGAPVFIDEMTTPNYLPNRYIGPFGS